MECTNDKVLLQSTEKYNQHPIINQIGKEYKNYYTWDFPSMWWLRLHTYTAMDAGSIPGHGNYPTYPAHCKYIYMQTQCTYTNTCM